MNNYVFINETNMNVEEFNWILEEISSTIEGLYDKPYKIYLRTQDEMSPTSDYLLIQIEDCFITIPFSFEEVVNKILTEEIKKIVDKN